MLNVLGWAYNSRYFMFAPCMNHTHAHTQIHMHLHVHLHVHIHTQAQHAAETIKRRQKVEECAERIKKEKTLVRNVKKESSALTLATERQNVLVCVHARICMHVFSTSWNTYVFAYMHACTRTYLHTERTNANLSWHSYCRYSS